MQAAKKAKATPRDDLEAEADDNMQDVQDEEQAGDSDDEEPAPKTPSRRKKANPKVLCQLLLKSAFLRLTIGTSNVHDCTGGIEGI